MLNIIAYILAISFIGLLIMACGAAYERRSILKKIDNNLALGIPLEKCIEIERQERLTSLIKN